MLGQCRRRWASIGPALGQCLVCAGSFDKPHGRGPRVVVSTAAFHGSSLVGRWGYRAPPGNQFLIDVSRLQKYHRKRFAMLKS